MQWFCPLLESCSEPVRILDVGGPAAFWKTHVPELPRRVQITLLNLVPAETDGLANASAVIGDARNMHEFTDRAFDVCFSNSVIEHVGTFLDQQAMAREIQRVAQAYFVQTPNRYFPVEPHFLFPFWQFLPRGLRVLLHQRLRLGWMPRQSDPLLARAEVEQIRLLNASEMKQLFPNARICREKFGGLTKSIIAIRKPGS
jgi:hypothetical protein